MSAVGPRGEPLIPLDRRLLWLLPLAFLIHDAEELATIPTWLAVHADMVASLMPHWLGISEQSLILAMDPARLLLAMGAMLLLLTGATAFASLSRSKAALYLYGLVLGGFFLHGFGHLAQALLLRSYAPGIISAALIVIPVSLFLYRAIRRNGALSWTEIAALATAGAALVMPAILLALSIGRALER